MNTVFKTVARVTAIATTAGATLAGLAFAFGVPAYATGTHPVAPITFETCKNLAGWDTNGDETDRKPTPSAAGLIFKPGNLIHHATSVALADLKPGSFLATAAPDQPSFFSVEVRDTTTGGYGTLRWDTVKSKWVIVIGAGGPAAAPATDGTFEGADPVQLLTGKVSKWGAFGPGTKVVSFGVGYTKTPAGSVTTTVKAVTFGGKTYELSCHPLPVKPLPQPSKSHSHKPIPRPSKTLPHKPIPSASTSHSAPAAKPIPSKTTSTSVAGVVPAGNTGGSDGGSLPVTGVNGSAIIGIGALLLLGGGGLFLAMRRRKVNFTA